MSFIKRTPQSRRRIVHIFASSRFAIFSIATCLIYRSELCVFIALGVKARRPSDLLTSISKSCSRFRRWENVYKDYGYRKYRIRALMENTEKFRKLISDSEFLFIQGQTFIGAKTYFAIFSPAAILWTMWTRRSSRWDGRRGNNKSPQIYTSGLAFALAYGRWWSLHSEMESQWFSTIAHTQALNTWNYKLISSFGILHFLQWIIKHGFLKSKFS